MSLGESIHPFPWKSLPAIPRAEAAALRDARRWVTGHVRLDAFALALRELVGAPVRLEVSRATRLGTTARGRALEGGVGLLLARADEDEPPTAVLEVETALAAAVVAPVLRRPSPVLPRMENAASVLSPSIAGAFAAVFAAATRRACEGSVFRVTSAGAAAALEAEFLGTVRADAQTLLLLSLTVRVGDDAYAARLLLSRVDAFAVPPVEWTGRRLASLGATPLSLPLVACATRATVAEVAALRAGDAWLPGTWPLERTSGASLRGPVLLAPPSSATGCRRGSSRGTASCYPATSMRFAKRRRR